MGARGIGKCSVSLGLACSFQMLPPGMAASLHPLLDIQAMNFCLFAVVVIFLAIALITMAGDW
eukprot:scaffold22382_cov18-Tisochrysis_lutea.AAC.1